MNSSRSSNEPSKASLKSADALFADSQFEDAFASYSAVLLESNKYPRTNVTLARAHIGRGDVYFNNKKFDEAIRSYKKAFVLNPNSSLEAEHYLKESYLKCAKAYREIGDQNAALNYFVEAFILDTACIEARAAISKQDSHTHELFYVVKSLMNNPKDDAIHLSLIWYFGESKQLDKLLFCSERILKSNPKCIGALLAAADVYVNRNKAKALQYYTEVISHAPCQAVAYAKRSFLYLMRDQVELGVKDLVNVVRLNPDILYDQNQLDKTRWCISLILEHYPEFKTHQGILKIKARLDKPPVVSVTKVSVFLSTNNKTNTHSKLIIAEPQAKRNLHGPSR